MDKTMKWDAEKKLRKAAGASNKLKTGEKKKCEKDCKNQRKGHKPQVKFEGQTKGLPKKM
jgi:hypothetical protein